MNNSVEQTFSFLYNAKKMIDDDELKVKELHKSRHNHFLHAREFSKKISKRIYNEIENNAYLFKDLFIYMLYKHAFGEEIKLRSINIDEVKNVKKIFTIKQLKIDEDFILNINKQLKLKSINEFFEIRENGEPIIYELIKKNLITPAIFIKFFDEATLTNEKKDVILKNENYERFEKTMKIIIKIIKGGLDE